MVEMTESARKTLEAGWATDSQTGLAFQLWRYGFSANPKMLEHLGPVRYVQVTSGQHKWPRAAMALPEPWGTYQVETYSTKEL
jgi:hypothetical protein